MRKIFFAAVALLSFTPYVLEVDQTWYESLEVRADVVYAAPYEIAQPMRLAIPSIKLDSPIEHVGLNEKGEMDVPSGTTNTVGWYGVVPGETGSAVMDAHVYAAFKQLHEVREGETISVETDSGAVLHFVVMDVETYALDAVPREMLFARADGAWLNLITCAGAWNAARDTYNQRLIVFAKLAN
ncbi:MAG: class F sortase [Parcubacteria group bacterium]|nr:class F sortase [Parcubacteria group bacterium]